MNDLERGPISQLMGPRPLVVNSPKVGPIFSIKLLLEFKRVPLLLGHPVHLMKSAMRQLNNVHSQLNNVHSQLHSVHSQLNSVHSQLNNVH